MIIYTYIKLSVYTHRYTRIYICIHTDTTIHNLILKYIDNDSNTWTPNNIDDADDDADDDDGICVHRCPNIGVQTHRCPNIGVQTATRQNAGGPSSP